MAKGTNLDMTLDDLIWEIVRRNADYQADYHAIQEGSTAKQQDLRKKWGLRRIEDPTLPWNKCEIKFPSGAKRIVSPAKAREGWQNDSVVIKSFGEAKNHTDDFLCLTINPLESLDRIFEGVKAQVEMKRLALTGSKKAPSKETISKRLKWLKIVDKVRAKNAIPTRKTFTSLYKTNYRRKIYQYCYGLILIESPLEAPLRPLSRDDADSYAKQKGLIKSRQ